MKNVKKWLLGFTAFALCFVLNSCTQAVAQDSVVTPIDVKVTSPESDAVLLQQVENQTLGKVKLPLRLQVPPSATGGTIDLNVTFTNPQVGTSIGSWLKDNWISFVAILMVVIQAIVNLTPTATDNSIFLLLKRLFDSIFPNRVVPTTTVKT
jgi:hypothetical protein